MKSPDSLRQTRAFTLLELLLVVVIVAILAALLLPALSKAKGRGRQIECLNQLKQVGLAAHGFAHDHGDRFPFEVSMKEGGTLELVRAAGGLANEVYFGFRHFQALSNELDQTKLLLCPADSRTSAANFISLRNEHISYFAAVTAEYARPDSLLAGDRNIVRSDGSSGPILRMAGSEVAGWTSEGHGFKGNLLFSDGHVERTTTAGLQQVLLNRPIPVSAWLPFVPPPSANAAAPGGRNGSAGGGNIGNDAGGASGFAVLQNFFQPPPNPPGSPPVIPPPPAVPITPAPAGVPPEAVLPNPIPQQPAPPKAPALVARPVAPVEPQVENPTNAVEKVTTQTPVNVFLIFINPEQRSYWILVLLLAMLALVLFGVVFQKRRKDRQRPIPSEGETAAPLPPRP